MTRPAWAPQEVDVDRPGAARVDDHHLGGSHDLAGDREPTRRAVADRTPMRSHAEVLRYFDGFELVEPGPVPLVDRRPDSPTEGAPVPGHAGVGRRD